MYPSLANNDTPSAMLRDKVERGELGIKTGRGFFAWDAPSIEREKARYEAMLLAGLALLKDELPRRSES